MKKVILDIETDSLDATKIWCCICQDVSQPGTAMFTDGKSLAKHLDTYDKVIGHNAISFDVPVLNRLWHTAIPLSKIEDTLVLSQLFSPNRDGGHSLAAWGDRFGLAKEEFTDFEGGLSRQMVDYCIRDVELTVKLYRHLIAQEKLDFSDESITIEYKIRHILNKQQKHGFFLDVRKAHALLLETKGKADEIKASILEEAQPVVKFVRSVEPKYKKNGDISSVGLKSYPNYASVVGGCYSSIEYQPFNIASPKQIVERLDRYGWKPTELTPTGGAKVSEHNLRTVSEDAPAAFKNLADWRMLETRWKTAEAWLDAADSKDYVHGRVMTMGAITGRMTHSAPNMANVVSNRKPYGEQCRACWTVENPSEYRLVGTDAKGLELRMLAHYINDDEFSEAVVNGDPHTMNQEAAGLPTRDAAKTFIYALMYGAGSRKIGEIVGGSQKAGEKLKQTYFRNMPALAKLITQSQRYADRGYLRGIDGRRLIVRHSHAALNTLLQGAGAIVCKQWSILLDQEIRRLGLDANLCNSIHDELQFQVHKDDAEQLCSLADTTMQLVGCGFNMNVALGASATIGLTWAETH